MNWSLYKLRNYSLHVRANAKCDRLFPFLSQGRKSVQGGAPSERNKLQMIKPNCTDIDILNWAQCIVSGVTEEYMQRKQLVE